MEAETGAVAMMPAVQDLARQDPAGLAVHAQPDGAAIAAGTPLSGTSK